MGAQAGANHTRGAYLRTAKKVGARQLAQACCPKLRRAQEAADARMRGGSGVAGRLAQLHRFSRHLFQQVAVVQELVKGAHASVQDRKDVLQKILLTGALGQN